MRILSWLLLSGAFVAFLCGGALIFLLGQDLVPGDLYHRFEHVKPSVVLDDQDQVLFRFELDCRTYTTIDKIPDVVIKAFVAAEDHNFFNHMGVSMKGIIRSSLVNLYHRKVVQGASTITQQVARLLFLTHERTWWRKIQEVLLAVQLERLYTKHQIFELYLNNMYFGRGIYGVEAACRRFWGKSVGEVSLDEAATLAAVAKSAKFFSPINAPHSAKKRRNVVLTSMRQMNFILSETCELEQKKPLKIVEGPLHNPVRQYVQEWIRSWAEQRWGKEALYTQGLVIKTTINAQVQRAAEESFVRVVLPMRRKHSSQLNGGLVTLDVTSGAVKAFVGGTDFQDSQFNRAFQAYRQLGSSFKPILYALALASGLEMDDLFVDEKTNFVMPSGAVWTPKNWNNKFEGQMTLVRALTYSNNLIAIKVLLRVGIKNLVTMARSFGLSRGLVPYPSLALGIVEGTTLDNAAAFNVFANNGVYVQPYFIDWVKNFEGRKLWEHDVVRKRLVDPLVVGKMVKALQLRMELSKKHSKEGWFDAESIGKTGSTNGAVTTWFVGSTPEYTTAVYIGRDDGKPMGIDIFASKTVYPLWLSLHKDLVYKKKTFYTVPELSLEYINWVTGEKIDPWAAQNSSQSDVVAIAKERG